MKKLAVTLGTLVLGGGLSFGQTGYQKEEKAVRPMKPVVETMGMASVVSNVDYADEALKTMMADEEQGERGVAGVSRKAGWLAKAPVSPPYKCGFDSKEVMDDWIVVDGDGDGKTWYWSSYRSGLPQFNGDENSGYAISLFRSATLGGYQSDFLITGAPISMPAGAAYVGVHVGTKMAGASDSLCVYYSKKLEADFKTLTYVGSVVNPEVGWKHQVFNFNIAEAGDYYFYFVNCSRADQVALRVDNVEIGTGTFVGGDPDLAVERLVLPISSCSLGKEEKISVQVKNIGLTAISKVKLQYSVNGGAPVEQIFEKEIGISESVYLGFTEKADFSEPDKAYAVELKAEMLACGSGEAEVREDNNTAAGRVMRFSPQEVPYEVDLRTEEGLSQVGFGVGYWQKTEYGLNGLLAEAPLTTRCLSLDGFSDYRVYIQYKAGILFAEMAVMPSGFDLLYGETGTAISGWEVLKTYENETAWTNGELGEDEFTFQTEMGGDYSFAIVPKADLMGSYNAELYIAVIRIESLRVHDVKVGALRSSLGTLTPVQHAVNPTFGVDVINRGQMDEKVKVTAKQGEAVVGSSKTVPLKTRDTVRCMFTGTLPRPQVGDEVALTFQADMDGVTDEYPADNTCTWRFTATDDVYAFDDVTIENYEDGIGMNGGYPFGHVFTLAEQDTLTAVQFGWYDLSTALATAFKVGLGVYAVDEDGKVGACLLSEQFDRNLAGGIQTVEIPARVLSAGRYFIAVSQLTSTHIALGFDENPVGYTSVMDNNGQLVSIPGGYVALRAVFGHEATAPAKDIAVTLLKPRDRGIFAANEPIEVHYINNGHMAADVEFICTVDGQLVKTEKKHVPGYAWGTVLFEADLSKVALHEVKVEAIVSGDDVPQNNVAQKTVECAPFDPYVMDFELCEDFAIDNLAPWKTVDVDGKYTSGIGGVTWPNVNQPQAFMAFNPSAVPVNTIEPHDGDRLGAVFALVQKAGRNNDWLISPKLKMPARQASMSFYAKAFRPSVYPEYFNIWVSTTSDDLEEFMQIGETYTAPAEWEEVTVNLEMFNGKEVYVAIQCVSDQAWIFMVDDIQVSRPTPNEEVADLSAYVKSYPNPAADVWTVTAYGLEINRVEICDMAGSVVFRSAGSLATDAYRVHMGGFKPGLYMARVYTNAGVQTLKVVVR